MVKILLPLLSVFFCFANYAIAQWRDVDMSEKLYLSNCQYRLRQQMNGSDVYYESFRGAKLAEEDRGIEMLFALPNHVTETRRLIDAAETPSLSYPGLLANPDYLPMSATVRYRAGVVPQPGSYRFLVDTVWRYVPPGGAQGQEPFVNFTFAAKASELSVQAFCQNQTPWQSGENGSINVNVNPDSTMGYNFIPRKNGRITDLAGFFNGVRTISLWETVSGLLVARATVNSSNAWTKVAIAPVPVLAGRKYTVAVSHPGTLRGVTRTNLSKPFPRQFGDILITGGTMSSGSTRPTVDLQTTIGQVDISFEPY